MFQHVQIDIKINGPAVVDSTDAIRQVKNGQPLIGVSIKDFDLKPMSLGKVTATIAVKGPQPDAQPVETVYEFEVK